MRRGVLVVGREGRRFRRTWRRSQAHRRICSRWSACVVEKNCAGLNPGRVINTVINSSPKSLRLTNFYHPRSEGISAFYGALLDYANGCGREMRLVVPGEQNGCETVGARGKVYMVQSPRSPWIDERYRLSFWKRWHPASPWSRPIPAEFSPTRTTECLAERSLPGSAGKACGRYLSTRCRPDKGSAAAGRTAEEHDWKIVAERFFNILDTLHEQGWAADGLVAPPVWRHAPLSSHELEKEDCDVLRHSTMLYVAGTRSSLPVALATLLVSNAGSALAIVPRCSKRSLRPVAATKFRAIWLRSIKPSGRNSRARTRPVGSRGCSR